MIKFYHCTSARFFQALSALEEPGRHHYGAEALTFRQWLRRSSS